MEALRPLSDPRDYQVAVLATLVVAGSTVLDIGVEPAHAAVMLAAAQVTQFLCGRISGLRPFDPRSALVTGLSLTMLLRTDGLALAALAAVIAIVSKFLLRIRGKHLFNPANGAIVGLMLATDGAWISSGQWGSGTLSALALSGLGFIVLTRARRAETTLAFLGCYALLLAARALSLGDPLVVPLHHLANGALLVFAFFMISDPKTTPDSAAGRVIFGATVACVAFGIQFVLYRPYAPLVALFFSMPLVPLLDVLNAGPRYRWQAAGPRHEPIQR